MAVGYARTVQAGRVGAVPLGHNQGFGPLAFISFSYFLSLIKSMKNSKICVSLV
jgi:hypothetical protein